MLIEYTSLMTEGLILIGTDILTLSLRYNLYVNTFCILYLYIVDVECILLAFAWQHDENRF